MPYDSSTPMNRRDHHCSPIAPRLLLALMPPSTRRGLDGSGQSRQSLIGVFRQGTLAEPTVPPPGAQPPGTQPPVAWPLPPAASFGYRLGSQRDDLAQLSHGQLGQPALAGTDNSLGQRLLLLDHHVDPLFHRADADELAYLDVLALPDPEGPVGGLILHRGIPPAVDVDDMIGGGQIQPGAAGLEGQDEHRRIRYLLKSSHHRIALLF